MPSLRELEARLLQTARIETTEQETEGERAGMYVFRDENGEKWMWSPRPYRWEFNTVQDPAQADHISFLCPLCFQKNGGAKGTHSVFVSFHGRNAPDECGSRNSQGQPSRWNISGTSLDDLVLTPSILLDAGQPAERGCHWHGFVGSSGVPPGHAA